MTGKYRLTTLGCKVNQYETEQVRELLESLGLRPALDGEQADIAVVNTCAVTTNASAKSRQALRRHSRDGDKATIAIGCSATSEPDKLGKINGVTGVFGHDSDVLAEVRKLLADRLQINKANPLEELPAKSATGDSPTNFVRIGLPSEPREAVTIAAGLETAVSSAAIPDQPEIPTTTTSISLPLAGVNHAALPDGGVTRFATRTRAFLKIQDGCDAHCTYCIIPKLRSKLYWKPVNDAVDEARRLVDAGHREIVLTGIFMGAYGRDTALRRRFEPGIAPLATLIGALAKVPGLERLRLSSLEPGDVDDALLGVLSAHPNCVPHLHLPLQAGSEDVLRRMNRQYTVDDFRRMIGQVNERLDRPAISTDIIVGFPGETDDLFAETLAVARESGFCKIHAFPFSPRPGTAANRWGKQFVHQQTVKDRMGELAALERELAGAYRAQFLGETTRVIVEETLPGDDNYVLAAGRSDRYFEVHTPAPTRVRGGDLIEVHIARITPARVHGELVIDGSSAGLPLTQQSADRP